MYALMSIFGVGIMKSIDPRICMSIGIFQTVIAFFFIGLWKELIIIIIALGLLGIGGSIMYSNF